MESTIVILVPEAEGLVQSFRDRYDPSAKVGMPAHITLLYPFKSPDEIDEVALYTLRHCFLRFPPFKFSLKTINQFAGETLYLVPEPEDPFRELTLGIWGCYPETPPYRGRLLERNNRHSCLPVRDRISTGNLGSRTGSGK